jgi:hypothetical protein
LGGDRIETPNMPVSGESMDMRRRKMKKIMTLLTIYEDGYTEYSGNCEFCKTFPCRHVSPDGEIDAKVNGYLIKQPKRMKVKG